MALRSASPACWNFSHHCASSAGTSPLAALRTRKSYPARNLSCIRSAKGRRPLLCSKRGCDAQISFMIAVKRRGMASLSVWMSSTASIAWNSAGIGFSPRCWAFFHAASTSCHRSAANRNAGDTLPRAHPAVGLLERESDEALPHRLLEHDVEQRQEAPVQAFAAQLAQARRRVAREQQLLHFLVHPRR